MREQRADRLPSKFGSRTDLGVLHKTELVAGLLWVAMAVNADVLFMSIYREKEEYYIITN